MTDPLITLTTDFGPGSPYVAALKGVLLSLHPAARLLDLSHSVPPQDLRHAAFFLAAAVPYFPPGTLHVIVVDPGVGTERHLLYVETGGQRLLVPDNGCWTALPGSAAPRVIRLTERAYWREPVSATFHGRDVLAPVAARLALGLDPALLGPPADDWVRLDLPAPQLGPDALRGEVVFVDGFGNLITNVPGEAYLARPGRVAVGGVEAARRVRTYGEAAPGELVALVSSSGMLEIAVAQGSAAARLGVGVGAEVAVTG